MLEALGSYWVMWLYFDAMFLHIWYNHWGIWKNRAFFIIFPSVKQHMACL